ncbi:hypothetical protein KIN20_031067 [Parelaphostrongylus tenuis]|uniref:Uncharacterized protein n=1 Tax=Parelaphostrongylus tenuis TaxID=148309 RepID=A0AAD5WHC3_PARTN|nr:hypothetical protein KIN20_031067 [Parelaphostrongylus tenuis]
MIHEAIHPSGVGKLIPDWSQNCLRISSTDSAQRGRPRVIVKARCPSPSLASQTLPPAMVYSSKSNIQDIFSTSPNEVVAGSVVERLVMQTIKNSLTCIIVDNRVKGICSTKMDDKKYGKTNAKDMVTVTSVNDIYLTIPETLSACPAHFFETCLMKKGNLADHKYHNGELFENDVAKCSGQSSRMLASGPFKSHFFSPRATVGGN